MKIHERHLDNFDSCPVCGLASTGSCKCKLGDRSCSKGHAWFRCPQHNRLVIGKSSHKLNLCLCIEDKTFNDNGDPVFQKMKLPSPFLKGFVNQCQDCKGAGGQNGKGLKNKEEWIACLSCRGSGFRPNSDGFAVLIYIKKWIS